MCSRGPVVALALVSALAAAPGPSAVLPQLNDGSIGRFVIGVKDSVLYIRARHLNQNGTQSEFTSGTGFIITQSGLVLTCHHVLTGLLPGSSLPSDARLAAEASFQGAGGPFAALEVVALDAALDVAILSLPAGLIYRPMRLSTTDGLDVYGSVMGLGFPVGHVVTAVGQLQGKDAANNWYTNAPIERGYSGGPVVRRDGVVIGFTRESPSAQSKLTVFSPLDRVAGVLERAGVKLVAVPLPPSQTLIPSRNDIELAGDCDSRKARMTAGAPGTRWSCQSVEVPAGGKPEIEITRDVAVSVPRSAQVLGVYYFHRSRGDSRRPTAAGPWHANSPDVDLQWMQIDTATIASEASEVRVSSTCRNRSENLAMHCAIGVHYRDGVYLW